MGETGETTRPGRTAGDRTRWLDFWPALWPRDGPGLGTRESGLSGDSESVVSFDDKGEVILSWVASFPVELVVVELSEKNHK